MTRPRRFSVALTRAICCLVLLLSRSSVPSASGQTTPTIRPLFSFACTVTASGLHPQVLVCPNGTGPNSLLQSFDGNFYGTTTLGGSGNKPSGTVFKITPAGQLTTLYTFAPDQNGNYLNGEFPTSLVEGNDGFLYGTAAEGGTNHVGVVFKLSKTGAFQVLHTAVAPGDP